MHSLHEEIGHLICSHTIMIAFFVLSLMFNLMSRQHKVSKNSSGQGVENGPALIRRNQCGSWPCAAGRMHVIALFCCGMMKRALLTYAELESVRRDEADGVCSSSRVL